MLGSIQNVYVPGMLPMVSKELGNTFLRKIIVQSAAVVSVDAFMVL